MVEREEERMRGCRGDGFTGWVEDGQREWGKEKGMMKRETRRGGVVRGGGGQCGSWR